MYIVGLTTIPERLENDLTLRCIKSILKQSVSVNYIIVNIPSISHKGIRYNILKANELSRIDKKIIVNYGIKDEGPITKLFGTLDYIKYQNIIVDKIILVDDDVEYNDQVINYLISQNKPAVGFVGRDYNLKYYNENNNIENIIFLETFASVCYDINLFDINAMRIWIKELPLESFYVDDIVIGAWLWKNNIKLYKRFV
jgi:hypothetical protein